MANNLSRIVAVSLLGTVAILLARPELRHSQFFNLIKELLWHFENLIKRKKAISVETKTTAPIAVSDSPDRFQSDDFQPVDRICTDELVFEGAHIWPELERLRLPDSKALVERMTQDSRDVLSTHPVIFIGWTGQGKSSLIKALLNQLGHKGDSGPLPAIGNAGQKTRGAWSYYVDTRVADRPGRVMFIDTEGFSPSTTTEILQNCKSKILEAKVSQDVFQQRLVFVLVIGVTPTDLRLLEDPMSTDILQSVCRDFCAKNRAQNDAKPRLQIVYTKADAMECFKKDVEQISTNRLRTAVGDVMQVEEPIFISNNNNGMGQVPELTRLLLQTFKCDLQSENMLEISRRSLAKSAIRWMRDLWAETGLESEDIMARRCAFAITRAYGRRWKEQRWPSPMTFADVEFLASTLDRMPDPLRAEDKLCSCREKEYHQDCLRSLQHTTLPDRGTTDTSFCECKHGTSRPYFSMLDRAPQPTCLDQVMTSVRSFLDAVADYWKSELLTKGLPQAQAEREVTETQVSCSHLGDLLITEWFQWQGKLEAGSAAEQNPTHPETVAAVIWTSASTASVLGGNREFCWLVNWCIRSRKTEELVVKLAPFVKALNRCASPVRFQTLQTPWDKLRPDWKLYRGGGFKMEHKSFFKNGTEFTVPGFWATTTSKAVAVCFLERAARNVDLQPVMWIVKVDSVHRCSHVTYLDRTLITRADGSPKEEEFLFTQYSSFKVLNTDWQEDENGNPNASQDSPHRIEVQALPNNGSATPVPKAAPWN
jgi:GTP-binding protein EngB required for normal cell division